MKLLKATGKNSKYEKISSLLISFLSHTQIIFLFNCCQSFKNHKKPKLSKKKSTQNNHIPKETHKGQFSKGNPPLKCIIFNLKLQYFTVLPEMNKEIHQRDRFYFRDFCWKEKYTRKPPERSQEKSYYDHYKLK